MAQARALIAKALEGKTEAHPACAVLEYIPWIKDCFTDPAEVVDGHFRMPGEPGAGTTPTAAAWERFRRPTG